MKWLDEYDCVSDMCCMKHGHRFKDISGQKFNRWTVISFDGSETGHSRWICRCDCGVNRSVNGHMLRGGSSKSCGCIGRESLSKMTLTHGEARHGSETPEFTAWSSMRGRCGNPNHKQYSYYGGRGIRVCDRWQNNFENFLCDMGRRPSEKHSLDRYPNNDGNYEPGNCRWATSREQNQNKRGTRTLVALGRAQLMVEWQRETGIGEATIRARLKRGWTNDQAVSVPANSFEPLARRVM